jgi:hypothetical protein
MTKAWTVLLIPAAVFALKVGSCLLDRDKPTPSPIYNYSIYKDNYETLTAYLDREERRLQEIYEGFDGGLLGDVNRTIEGMDAINDIHREIAPGLIRDPPLIRDIKDLLAYFDNQQQEEFERFRNDIDQEGVISSLELNEMIEKVQSYDQLYLNWKEEYEDDFPQLFAQRRADRDSISHIIGNYTERD